MSCRPLQGLWAVDQFVALGCLLVPRCGASSAGRVLSAPLVSMLGTDWVVAPHRVVSFVCHEPGGGGASPGGTFRRYMCYLYVSPTLGVLPRGGPRVVPDVGCLRGWVDHGTAIAERRRGLGAELGMMDVGTGAILRDMEDNPAISTSSRWAVAAGIEFYPIDGRDDEDLLCIWSVASRDAIRQKPVIVDYSTCKIEHESFCTLQLRGNSSDELIVGSLSQRKFKLTFCDLAHTFQHGELTVLRSETVSLLPELPRCVYLGGIYMADTPDPKVLLYDQHSEELQCWTLNGEVVSQKAGFPKGGITQLDSTHFIIKDKIYDIANIAAPCVTSKFGPALHYTHVGKEFAMVDLDSNGTWTVFEIFSEVKLLLLHIPKPTSIPYFCVV
ncbi:hypothetical protein Pelo_17621 [Pelomyxa schiedti]|nr:hypothetical protein Pelo_17621 [Pelomyxa schiedti]